MVNIASGSNPITQEPQVTPLDVSLTVFNEDGCDFGWGYDDVPGSTVTVSVDGIPVAFDQLPRFGEDNVVFCDFKVSIPGVPTGGFWKRDARVAGLFAHPTCQCSGGHAQF